MVITCPSLAPLIRAEPLTVVAATGCKTTAGPAAGGAPGRVEVASAAPMAAPTPLVRSASPATAPTTAHRRSPRRGAGRPRVPAFPRRVGPAAPAAGPARRATRGRGCAGRPRRRRCWPGRVDSRRTAAGEPPHRRPPPDRARRRAPRATPPADAAPTRPRRSAFRRLEDLGEPAQPAEGAGLDRPERQLQPLRDLGLRLVGEVRQRKHLALLAGQPGERRTDLLGAGVALEQLPPVFAGDLSQLGERHHLPVAAYGVDGALAGDAEHPPLEAALRVVELPAAPHLVKGALQDVLGLLPGQQPAQIAQHHRTEGGVALAEDLGLLDQ